MNSISVANFKNLIPSDVFEINEIIRSHSRNLYLVGGCVRDMLCGKTVHDFDLATDMSAEQIHNIFRHGKYKGHSYNVIEIMGSLEHGVVFVLYNGTKYEIAQFRADVSTKDQRHADVKLGVSLEEDVKRRDFTVNAMAVDLNTFMLYDYVGGMADLKAGVIRAVGNAYERFQEDPLRVIRAYRFATSFSFALDDDVKLAINRIMLEESTKGEKVHTIFRSVSYERIREEFEKLFRCYLNKNVEDINQGAFFNIFTHLFNSSNGTDLFRILFPGVYQLSDISSAYHMLSVSLGSFILACKNSAYFQSLSAEKQVLMFWCYFMQVFVQSCADFKTCVLKFINTMPFTRKDKVYLLAVMQNCYHGSSINFFANHNSIYSIRLWASEYSAEVAQFVYIFNVLMSTVCHSAVSNERVWYRYLWEEPILTIRNLSVSGSDLSNAGFRGKRISEVLGELLKCVLSDRLPDNRNVLLNFAKNNYSQV